MSKAILCFLAQTLKNYYLDFFLAGMSPKRKSCDNWSIAIGSGELPLNHISESLLKNKNLATINITKSN